MEKLISIIIPCYNAEAFLDRCFNSLTLQTIGLNRLEIIFVDDASDDGSFRKLSEFEEAFPDAVTLVQCAENGRQGRARNIGLSYASCSYIAFLDADDWVEPEMYEVLYSKAVSYDCDVVCCNYLRDDGNGHISPGNSAYSSDGAAPEDRLLLIDTPEKRTSFLMAGSMQHSSCNKIIKRNIITENNLDFPEMLAYEDSYFCTLLYFYVSHVYISVLPLYHYYVNSNSTVLKMDMPYHHDMLTVNLLKWEAFRERNLLEQYKDVLEYDFLTYGYLSYLKVLFLRFTVLPYDAFISIKEETLKRIPHYENNPYVQTQITPFNQILLELLHKNISSGQLAEIADAALNYWNI